MNLLRIEKGYINISSVCMVVSQRWGGVPSGHRRGKQWLNGVQYPNFFGHIHIHAQNMFWNIQIDCIDWLYPYPKHVFLSGPLVSKFLSHSVWNRLRKGAPKIFIDRHSAHYFVKHLKTPNQLVTSIPLQTPTIKVAVLNQGPNLRAQQAFEQCYNLLTSAFPNDLPGRLARVAKPQKEGGTLPDARRGGFVLGKIKGNTAEENIWSFYKCLKSKKKGEIGGDIVHFEKRGNVFGCKRWTAKLNLWGRFHIVFRVYAAHIRMWSVKAAGIKGREWWVSFSNKMERVCDNIWGFMSTINSFVIEK